MDSETEEKVVNNLFSLPNNPTIVISTHRIQHLTRTNKIGIVVNGQIARLGPTNEIIKQQKA